MIFEATFLLGSVVIISFATPVPWSETQTNSSLKNEASALVVSHQDNFIKPIDDYDYYLLDPEGGTETDFFEVFSAKYWGCFQKINAIITGTSPDIMSSHHIVHSSIQCKKSCEFNGKCSMWSYTSTNSSNKETPNCLYVMQDNHIEDLNIKFASNSQLGFRTCESLKSGYVGCHEITQKQSDMDQYIEFVTHGDNDEYACIQLCEKQNYPYVIYSSKYCACGYSFPGLKITLTDVKCVQNNLPSNYAIYKTDAQFSDTVLCIIAANLDYEIEESLITINDLNSVLKCKERCQSLGETKCWMWWFNTTHCKLISRIDDHSGTFVKRPNSFLGFGTCGNKEISGSIYDHNILGSDSDISTDFSNEGIGHIAVFAIAFVVVLLLLVVVITFVCVRGKKNLEHRESSDNTSRNESSKLERNTHVIAGKNGEVSRTKKRYIDLLDKFNDTVITTPNLGLKVQKTNKEGKNGFIRNNNSTENNHAELQRDQLDYVTLDEWNNRRLNGQLVQQDGYDRNHSTVETEKFVDDNISTKDTDVTIAVVVHNKDGV